MGRLKGTAIYLAGPMDRVKDGGVGWRNDLTPFLEELGVNVLDPCKKPSSSIYAETPESRAKLFEFRKNKQYNKIRKHMRPIRKIDLNMIDHSTALIVNVDLNHYPCGTDEEIFWANRIKRPVILRCEQGKHQLPLWFFAALPHEMFFSTWDEVKTYLLGIDTRWDTRDFGRWIFFDDLEK